MQLAPSCLGEAGHLHPRSPLFAVSSEASEALVEEFIPKMMNRI